MVTIVTDRRTNVQFVQKGERAFYRLMRTVYRLCSQFVCTYNKKGGLLQADMIMNSLHYSLSIVFKPCFKPSAVHQTFKNDCKFLT